MLDKLLATLIYPLNLAIYALLLLGYLQPQPIYGRLLLGIGAMLWLASMPVVSDSLRGAWERRYPAERAADFPAADAIVVLGGGINPALPPRFPYADLGAAADRVWMAARLYHAGKAPRVIVSGGFIPWAGPHGSEADAMAALLMDLGVPDGVILREAASLNTRENAVNVASLLAAEAPPTPPAILLVTSALHLPRAAACFRATDLAMAMTVVPVATDHEVTAANFHPLRFLPDAGALEGTTRFLRELVGLAVYRWRGWAK